jgi:hypothetical protein
VIDPPAKYDITIHQGATFELVLQYKTSSGVPVDMTNYDVVAQLWNNNRNVKLSDFDFAWTSQVSGAFVLSLPATTTSNITESGQYDVLLTRPDGAQYYLLEGNAAWNPGLSYRP